MWISRERLLSLENKVRELEFSIKGPSSLTQRVSDLESNTEALRVGEPSKVIFLYPFASWDSRPTVSIRQAVKLIMDHLKLKLTKTDATPEKIELEKVK